MKNAFLFLTLLALLQNASAQNVGIGTASPSEKLHVSGNIRADTLKPNGLKLTTGAGAGKVLTSDATGNASWQATTNSSSNSNGNIGYGVWGNCETNSVITQYQPVEDTPYDAGGKFGFTVSISGSYAIVGAPYSDVGANNEQGSASIFKYEGNEWVFVQKISDISGAASDHFGYSVSISGLYAAVGAPQDDVGGNTDQGTVSLYRFNGSTWIFVQQLTDATGATGDGFGNSVSVSGIHLITGADGDDVGANADQGSASIFSLTGVTWSLANKLTASAGQASDHYGKSVSISGIYAAVGSYFDDLGANANQGTVKVYQNVAGNWVFVVSLSDPSGQADEEFGISVSLSGTTLLVGAPGDSRVIGPGSACIFQYDGTAWVFTKKLEQTDGSSPGGFGNSVSLSGNYALVGAKNDAANSKPAAGSATLFLKVGTSWAKLQYITDPRGKTSDYFGAGVAIDSTTQRFLIGGGNGTGLGFGVNANKAFFGKVY